jgi:RNA polymerase sigma-70 factor (ECF subfamily)
MAGEKKIKEVNYQFFKSGSEEAYDSAPLENQIHQLKEAIKFLPAKCKEIMLLKVADGLTHQEISEYLKISEKTVENQVTIAIKKIRKFMNKP